MGKRRRSEDPLTGCSRSNDQDWENQGAMASVLADGHMLWLILQRLPLHNLFQCKSVCKIWKSAISDLSFRRQYLSTCLGNKCLNAPQLEVYFESHLHNCKIRQGLLDHYRRRKRYCTILRFGIVGGQHEGPEKDDLLSTICHRSPNVCFPNELWLVQSACGAVLIFDGGQNQFLVYNPLSGAMAKFNPSPPVLDDFKVLFICRDPQGSGSNYDFKVVMIPSPDEYPGLDRNNSMMISTYSSNTSKWSKVPVPGRLLRTLNIFKDGLVVVRGKVYWSTRHQVVAVYDPETGHIDALPLPPFFKPPELDKCPALGQDASEAVLCCIFYHDGLDVLRLCRTTASSTQDMQISEHQLWTRIQRLGF